MRDYDLCRIEVILRKVTPRAVLISSTQNLNNHCASLNNDYISIPKSQIRHIQHLDGNKKILTLPKWLVMKNGLSECMKQK